MNNIGQFPPGFIWGAATAAYQIEGGWDSDGKGESIWDRYSHTPGKIADNSNGDIACDHYQRYREDVDLMAALGLQAYRFSISWPRIFPDGGTKPNQRGLDFYRRLVEALHERGIMPAATLYHWDLPQALQDRGGWPNRDTALRFAEYASYLFRNLGRDIPFWFTINEPFMAAYFGYVEGVNAPGIKHPWAFLPACHHLLLAHGLAVEAFRAALPQSDGNGKQPQIGIVMQLWPQHPASQRPADLRATRISDGAMHRLFLEPLFRKQYPEDMLRHFGRRLMRLPIKPGDLDVISRPLDLVGINTYTRLVNKANPWDLASGVRQLPGREPATAMGWEIYPDAMVEALRKLREYTDLPLYVTENGAAFDDPPPDPASGVIDDSQRVAFLREYLLACRRAIDEGIDLRGYFVWTLLDNFEWQHGYTKRFGIFAVDQHNQRRIWKRSAEFYRSVIAANAVPPEA